MIAAWIAKNSRHVLIGVTVALVLLMLFAASQCSNRESKRAVAVQAEQTTKSGEAIASAASAAVETVDTRHGAETAIDDATAAAMKEIGNAENSEDVHAAVVRAYCERLQRSGRTDPACIVRPAGSR